MNQKEFDDKITKLEKHYDNVIEAAKGFLIASTTIVILYTLVLIYMFLKYMV